MAARTIHVLQWPALDERRVRSLMRSIQDVGLLQGVVVREPTTQELIERGWDGSHYVVVAGFHRAKAYERLNRGKLDELPFRMVDPDVDLEAVEIDENLVRAHLDAEELAALTARRVAVKGTGPEDDRFSEGASENRSDREPKTGARRKAERLGRKQPGTSGGRPPRPAVKEVAEELGVTPRTIRERLARAEGRKPLTTAEPRRFKILLDLDDSEKFCRQLVQLAGKMTPEARRRAAEIMLAGLE